MERVDPDPGFEDAQTLGLRRYVADVAAELGLAAECSGTDPGPPATAHLAVDGNLPSFPDRDLSLLWDEEYGWAAAVETRSGEAPVVISYLGGDVLAAKGDVAAFLTALRGGEHPGDPRPIRLRAYGAADDLVDRLGRYPA